MRTANIASSIPRVKLERPDGPSIPFLRPGKLAVVVGDQADLVAARLAVTAAAGGLRSFQYDPGVVLRPECYAEVVKDAARHTHQLALSVPHPRAEKAFCDVADLIVEAPNGAGNWAWLIAEQNMFPVTLPDFPAEICRLLVPLLLAGAVKLGDRHKARPVIDVAPWCWSMLESHFASRSITVH